MIFQENRVRPRERFLDPRAPLLPIFSKFIIIIFLIYKVRLG